MESAVFDRIALMAWEQVPPRFREQVRNVALLIEDEPDPLTREEQELREGDTLLGIYRGVPNTLRGVDYGIGGTLPDTITLYRLPILKQAQEQTSEEEPFEQVVERCIKETLWHEVAHYFGFDEPEIEEREGRGMNRFGD